MVELSQLYSNTFRKIVKYKRDHPVTSVNNTSEKPLRKVNSYGETEINRIRQQQKILSTEEIKHIIEEYGQGASTYALAKKYDCHRSTISAALKRNGIKVTNEVIGRKIRPEEVAEMHKSGMSIKKIAKRLHATEHTISQCLKAQGVNTKKTRWDYSEK